MHIHSLKLIARVSTYEVNSCKRFYGFCWLLQFLERVINCISQSSYATYVTINHYDYLFVSDKSESNGIFLRKHFTLTDKYLLFYSVYLIVVRFDSSKGLRRKTSFPAISLTSLNTNHLSYSVPLLFLKSPLLRHIT